MKIRSQFLSTSYFSLFISFFTSNFFRIFSELKGKYPKLVQEIEAIQVADNAPVEVNEKTTIPQQREIPESPTSGSHDVAGGANKVTEQPAIKPPSSFQRRERKCLSGYDLRRLWSRLMAKVKVK
jgi:hypothetical protein